jgi:uncharacterized membrane protein
MIDIGFWKHVMRSWSAALEVALDLAPPLLFIIGVTIVAGVFTVPKKSRREAVLLYGTFGLFGLAIGFFMGAASRDEKVVTALLPVIITLVSGYVAYIAQKNASASFVRLLPGAMCLLLLSTVFTSRYMKTLPEPTIGTGHLDHTPVPDSE